MAKIKLDIKALYRGCSEYTQALKLRLLNRDAAKKGKK